MSPPNAVGRPDYLSPQQFADANGIGIATVRRYIKAGRLAFVQPAGPGGRVLIPRDALTPFEPTGPATPPAQPPTSKPNQPTDLPGPMPKWRQGRDG